MWFKVYVQKGDDSTTLVKLETSFAAWNRRSFTVDWVPCRSTGILEGKMLRGVEQAVYHTVSR